MLTTFLLNLICAVAIFALGGYTVCAGIAHFILESTEAEILAKVRELKQMNKEENYEI